nr:NADH dehydrogenase subunit 6 [Coreamachilis coreanus]
MYVILMTITFMNLIMVSLNHPVAMGAILMIQTMLIAILLGNTYMSFWFSYVLFLIFLGGLLVLFIYVASLASNEMFYINFNPKMLITIVLLTILLYSLDFMMTPMKLYSSQSLPSNNNLNNLLMETLSKFYSSTISFMTLSLILYLLLTLIAVVKITKMNLGPLRKLL